MSEQNDSDLVEAAQRNIEAFGVLYQKYIDGVYRFIYRQVSSTHLAEDITSATFESALKALPRYKHQGHTFAAWLHKIALNHIRHHYRRQALLTFLPLNFGIEVPLPAGESENATLTTALRRLSATDRSIIHLRYFEDFTAEEASYIIGCSRETFYVKLHRALARLKKVLQQEQHYA